MILLLDHPVGLPDKITDRHSQDVLGHPREFANTGE